MSAAGALFTVLLLVCADRGAPSRTGTADSTGCACVTLRDSSGTKLLGGATVVALGLQKGAMSDSTGFARICPLPPGLVRLKAIAPGYWPAFDSLVVHRGRCDSLEIRLQRSPFVPEYVGIGPASKSRPSPVGVTTIRVWGDATDVVLVDPLGRVSRAEQLDTDIDIPDFDRWDGGTVTTLEDSTERPRPSNVVVAFELSRPLIGRYQMFAEAKGGGNFSAVVGFHGSATWTCNEVRSDVSKGVGRYVWSIDFSADTNHTKCPVRVFRATRAPKEKGSRP